MIYTDFYDCNINKISILRQNWHNEKAFSYKTKGRPNFGICYIISGGIRYRTELGDTFAKAGDLVLLEKGARYVAVFEGADTRDILINFEASIPADCSIHNGITLIKDRKDLSPRFEDILKYSQNSNRRYMVKSVFYSVLDSIVSTKSESAEFKKIKKIIDDDTSFSLKESEMADLCLMSVSSFQRTFKKESGKTVGEYRDELRITKAKEMLLSGEHSIEEIGSRLGYCDSAYFSRRFKKAVGLSPSSYIKSYRTM